MNKRSYTFILFFVGIYTLSFSQNVLSVGPMVHINFGNDRSPDVSWALEAAYWNLDRLPFKSIDFGLEFEKCPEESYDFSFRMYSELQTGIGIAGISCGPVLQWDGYGLEKVHLGVQASVWGNYFLGLDFRKRWINKGNYTCLGTYLKVPLFLGENGSGGDHHHNDYHHHDWD